MSDTFTHEERSRIMRAVKGRDTGPEKTVRSLLHRMGYRFRLHRTDIPGKPDIAFPGLKKAIFVHGCFWHGHEGCPRAARPSSNVEFWNRKIDANLARDARVKTELLERGWKALIVWQCEIRKGPLLEDKLKEFLNG